MVSEFDILDICAIFGTNAALVYFTKNKFQFRIEKSMDMKENKFAITKTTKYKAFDLFAQIVSTPYLSISTFVQSFISRSE